MFSSGGAFMKYKILVHSKNTSLIADFIQHSNTFFDTVSTSEYLPDVLAHFEFFKPDAFVCFMDNEPERTLSNLSVLKKEAAYNGAPVFVVADAETCDVVEEKLGFTVNVIIRRPVTQDNLTLRITRYFEEIKEAKEKMKAIAQARREEINAMEETEAKKAAESEKEKKHILIVDDDRTILKMLKTALSDKYDITTMANGIVVDKFLETKSADLIILDYEMPIETGADVFRKIKNNPKTAHIPVCFLTGVAEREKILEVMALKPHGYLLKPIDIDMLKSTISDLTE